MARLSLFAELAQLATIRTFVAQTGRDLGLGRQVTDDLVLAVDEACTNVLKHGYGGRGGKIELAVEAVEEGIRVIVRDWGAAFEPDAVPVPDVTAPLGARPLGGLGLFLMRQVMDDVDFAFDPQQGNTLTMVKRLIGGDDGH